MTDQKRIAKGMWWDRAWTLTKGCTPAGAGCLHCWSAAQSHIRNHQANPPECYVGVTDERGKWNGVVEPLPEMLDRPLHVRKPTTWAVWNDLFHHEVPERFIARAGDVMDDAPQHTYLILTKRVRRMRDLVGAGILGHRIVAKKNVWLGASASTQPELWRAFDALEQVNAAVRFVSLEPLVESIDVRPFLPALDWVIVGAESGHHRRECRMHWVADIVHQCDDAGVPCFVKQVDRGGRLVKAPPEYPQEMPERFQTEEYGG